MPYQETLDNRKNCPVQPLKVHDEILVPSNDNNLRAGIIAFIENEFALSRRFVAFCFDCIFLIFLFSLTYDYFSYYSYKAIVDILYILYPFFYYVCVPTISKGTIGMLLVNLRCIRSDGEDTEFWAYLNRFIAVNFLFIVYMILDMMVHSVNINSNFLEIIKNIRDHSFNIYIFWLMICFISVLCSPIHKGLYEYLSRTMIIKYLK